MLFYLRRLLPDLVPENKSLNWTLTVFSCLWFFSFPLGFFSPIFFFSLISCFCFCSTYKVLPPWTAFSASLWTNNSTFFQIQKQDILSCNSMVICLIRIIRNSLKRTQGPGPISIIYRILYYAPVFYKELNNKQPNEIIFLHLLWNSY